MFEINVCVKYFATNFLFKIEKKIEKNNFTAFTILFIVNKFDELWYEIY